MRCTRTGRVVYDRKPHYFSVKDMERIIEHVHDTFDRESLEKAAGYVRSAKLLIEKMYMKVAR